MEDVETLSDLLKILENVKTLFDLLINTEYCNNEFKHKVKLIIDKDYYILTYLNICCLFRVNFDFNSINFDIKLNNVNEYNYLIKLPGINSILKEKLYNYYNFEDIEINDFYEYINLFNIFKHNEHMRYKLFNNYDINNLTINNSINNNTENILTIEVIKFLEYKNFNFKLIELRVLIHTLRNEKTIKYIINNNLYNFENANKFDILKYCNSDTLLFWIDYLNIDVYQEYNQNNIYHYLTCNIINNDEIEKYFLIYDIYDLLITDNDIINIYSDSFYEFIIFYYDIDKLTSLKQENIKLILTKYKEINLIFSECIQNLKTYMSIIDLIDNSDIDLIIIIIKTITDINIIKDIFTKVIEKLNIDIIVIINYLKENTDLYILIEFYYLYYKYYNSNITNYTKYIFSETNYDLIYNQIQSISMFNDSKFKLLVELMDKYYLN